MGVLSRATDHVTSSIPTPLNYVYGTLGMVSVLQG